MVFKVRHKMFEFLGIFVWRIFFDKVSHYAKLDIGLLYFFFIHHNQAEIRKGGKQSGTSPHNHAHIAAADTVEKIEALLPWNAHFSTPSD